MADCGCAKWYALLNFVPLSVFMLTFRLGYGWPTAFTYGGAVALVALGLIIAKLIEGDSFLLTIHCFLIGGAAMIVCDIAWLQNIYSNFMQTTLLMWLGIVGVFTTFLAQGGFVGLPAIAGKDKIFKSSGILLLGVTVAIAFSLHFKGNLLLAGILPFAALRIFSEFLQRTYSP